MCNVLSVTWPQLFASLKRQCLSRRCAQCRLFVHVSFVDANLPPSPKSGVLSLFHERGGKQCLHIVASLRHAQVSFVNGYARRKRKKLNDKKSREFGLLGKRKSKKSVVDTGGIFKAGKPA